MFVCVVVLFCVCCNIRNHVSQFRHPVCHSMPRYRQCFGHPVQPAMVPGASQPSSAGPGAAPKSTLQVPLVPGQPVHPVQPAMVPKQPSPVHPQQGGGVSVEGLAGQEPWQTALQYIRRKSILLDALFEELIGLGTTRDSVAGQHMLAITCQLSEAAVDMNSYIDALNALVVVARQSQLVQPSVQPGDPTAAPPVMQCSAAPPPPPPLGPPPGQPQRPPPPPIPQCATRDIRLVQGFPGQPVQPLVAAKRMPKASPHLAGSSSSPAVQPPQAASI